MFSDEELSAPNDFSVPYNKYTIQSMNNVIRNTGKTATYFSGSDYVSGFLNFLNFETFYLASANLGEFSTLGACGESSIIKQIVVNRGFGSTIVNVNIIPHDFLGCSRQVLKTLH